MAGSRICSVLLLARLAQTASGDSTAKIVRVALTNWGTLSLSPFQRVPGLHSARFHVLDQVAFQGYPAREDTLAQPYLLFFAVGDGRVRELLHQLSEHIGATHLDEVWRNCEGYPEPPVGSAARVAYWERCIVPPGYPFHQYQATVEDVRSVTGLREAMFAFIAEHPDPEAAGFESAFRSFLDRHRPQLADPG